MPIWFPVRALFLPVDVTSPPCPQTAGGRGADREREGGRSRWVRLHRMNFGGHIQSTALSPGEAHLHLPSPHRHVPYTIMLYFPSQHFSFSNILYTIYLSLCYLYSSTRIKSQGFSLFILVLVAPMAEPSTQRANSIHTGVHTGEQPCAACDEPVGCGSDPHPTRPGAAAWQLGGVLERRGLSNQDLSAETCAVRSPGGWLLREPASSDLYESTWQTMGQEVDFPLLKLSFILCDIYMKQLQTAKTAPIYVLKNVLSTHSYYRANYTQKYPMTIF